MHIYVINYDIHVLAQMANKKVLFFYTNVLWFCSAWAQTRVLRGCSDGRLNVFGQPLPAILESRFGLRDELPLHYYPCVKTWMNVDAMRAMHALRLHPKPIANRLAQFLPTGSKYLQVPNTYK